MYRIAMEHKHIQPHSPTPAISNTSNAAQAHIGIYRIAGIGTMQSLAYFDYVILWANLLVAPHLAKCHNK